MKDVHIMKLNKKIEQSKITKDIFSIKVYFNIAVSQVSFITGKIPELGWTIAGLQWFGVSVSQKYTLAIIGIVFILLVLSGYMLKKSGLYNTEQYTHAKIDTVQDEILTTLRKLKRESEWMKNHIRNLK